MNKKVWLFMSAVTLATSVLAVACGDDDNAGSSGTTVTDGGPKADVTTTPGIDGGNPEAGPTGCTFASFVIGLEGMPANGTPSTDLGQSCTDSTSQADFASLFPAH